MGSFRDLAYHFNGDVLLLCHHNADPDAVCAAYAIKEMIHVLSPTAFVEVVCPDGASALTEKALTYLDMQVSSDSLVKRVETFVVVDTGSINQLEQWASRFKESTAFKIIVDHHTPDPEMERIADVYINEKEAVSTCEIVYRLMREAQIPIMEKTATALLTGISFDSRHFSLGSPATFRVGADLIELGADLRKSRELLQTTMDPSEKTARIKAAQRMTIHKADQWTIISAPLGSFQSSAARAFLSLGADVAVLAGEEKNLLQASFRSTEEFYQKTQVDLGEVSKSLGEEFKGSGGGHPTAAGFNGEGMEEAFLAKAVEVIKKKLRQLTRV